MNVSKLQEAVLRVLRSRNDPMAAIEIARAMDIHPWSVTPRMKPLERLGLVVRVGTGPRLNSENNMRNMQLWQVAHD